MFSALGAPGKVVDTVLESATHGGRYRLCAIYRIFSLRSNSKNCRISGVFSVQGAPRKVIDKVLESSTHGDQS